ncbi:hypothetical protein [Paenibacillus lemnae]|uniref:Uncharacterized protein n=1 Tax=Paenibacillus lemnae TaxID=1330551 RepID=A0A848M5D0_PAELE|nr:hypothetical protein [Paenibacillus lemnae]NMO95469.1 hypothetical protein [Paenibacillus lemnae]
MTHKEYKQLMDRVEPDSTFEERMVKSVMGQSNSNTGAGLIKKGNRNRMPIVTVALGGAFALGLVVVLMNSLGGQQPVNLAEPVQVSPSGTEQQNVEPSGSNEAVTIPAIELPKEDSGVQAKMIGLVVYQGQIYTQSRTTLSPETAKELLGDKLGRTRAGITEWSKEEDYTELASTIGEADIYAVNGYDPGFRIMSYTEIDGQVFAELYEHLNGITVASGEDLIGPLHMQGNVASVQWESYDSWNMGEGNKQTLEADESAVASFLDALYTAKPVAEEALADQDIYLAEGDVQRFVYITLEDGTTVQLRLFKNGGYVNYGMVPVLLQLDEASFSAFWEVMK